jgi:septum formation inhibitor-activating ATPase MinD
VFAIVLGIVLGIKKHITYGVILLMHGASKLSAFIAKDKHTAVGGR